MNNKLTKEQLLTALMIKLDQIEYKIEKIQGKLGMQIEPESAIDKLINEIVDTEEFDETYK